MGFSGACEHSPVAFHTRKNNTRTQPTRKPREGEHSQSVTAETPNAPLPAIPKRSDASLFTLHSSLFTLHSHRFARSAIVDRLASFHRVVGQDVLHKGEGKSHATVDDFNICIAVELPNIWLTMTLSRDSLAGYRAIITQHTSRYRFSSLIDDRARAVRLIFDSTNFRQYR